MLKYMGVLIVVKDIAKSRQFYYDVLGLEVICDFGENITLTGGISLQSINTWTGFIKKPQKELSFCHNTSELYFEVDDMESFVQKLSNRKDISYVHNMIEHSWGQRVIRFCDPDSHIIEVGENIEMVIRRFIEGGLSPEKTAERMDVPLAYINQCMAKK